MQNHPCFAAMKDRKIFFDDKPFYIVYTLTEPLQVLAKKESTLFLKNPSKAELEKSIDRLENSKLEAVVAWVDSVKDTFKTMKSLLKWLKAGGGLVKNELDEYLFIFRRGKWDLPKGKLDEGETMKECALREVREETGLQEIALGERLLRTWHVYHGYGKHVLKQTTWYRMECPKDQALVPQTEEDIEEVGWFQRAHWSVVLENTFPSIVDVLGAEEAYNRQINDALDK